MKSLSIRQLTIPLLLITFGGVLGYNIGIQSQSNPEKPLIQKVINITPPSQQKDVRFDQFWEVWQILEDTYVDPKKLDAQKQVYGAISGMTSALEDPYTFYLPPNDQKRSSEDLAGKFFGVGIELGYKDGILSVAAPLKNSPAEKAGVQAGDLIIKIVDQQKKIEKDTIGIPLDEAVEIIRGEKGSTVTLSMVRDRAKEPFDLSIQRDEIIVPSVELGFSEQGDKKAAVITLSRFGGRTDQEWNDIVSKILSEPSVDGVILDVRNNPGGYLEGAIDIASEFIADGVVVSQQGRDKTQKYTVSRNGRLTQLPIEVLINKGSASASEIVAGALRDRRDAKLFGENTFGKGTVQDAMELDGGAGLHVTVGKWLLPNGDWIHEKGIPATIEIKDNPDTTQDEVIDRALQDL